MLKVSFQGERGAYSEKAALQYFEEDIKPVACKDFEAVFDSVIKNTTDFGIIPVENALTGSIYQNFDLLLNKSVWISGEIKLKIDHVLMGLKTSQLKDITSVYSHPQALGQCDGYISKEVKLRPVPFFDTAGSAEYVAKSKNGAWAAIAGEHAAAQYGLKILARDIADNKANFTRFFIISNRLNKPESSSEKNNTKTSIVFAFKNIPGALFKALAIFAIRDIDLAKIESRPIHGSPWNYQFYLDFYGEVDSESVQNSLKHLEEITQMLKVLGSYTIAE